MIDNAGRRIVAAKRQEVFTKAHQIGDAPERDILSLLSRTRVSSAHSMSLTQTTVKSNMSEDATRRMSDQELTNQIGALLFAGSDTTSSAMAWCLHQLSLDPRIQKSLKEELQSLHSIEDMGSVDKLPYLNAVVQETLRFYPPAHSTIRVAMKDELIPLSYPVKLRGGTVVHEVPIRKGSYVHIPIEGLNMSKDIWGEDALMFE